MTRRGWGGLEGGDTPAAPLSLHHGHGACDHDYDHDYGHSHDHCDYAYDRIRVHPHNHDRATYREFEGLPSDEFGGEEAALEEATADLLGAPIVSAGLARRLCGR